MAEERREETRPAARTQDAGQRQVQERFTAEQEQGFVGIEIDPTPNVNYTVQGVSKGAPTPETDPRQAQKVGSTRFRGGTA